MLIYLPKPAWKCNFCFQQYLEKLLSNPLLHEKLAENINKTINCSDISKSESISDTSLTQNTSYKDDEAAQIPSISLEDILDPHVRYFYIILICKYNWFQGMALICKNMFAMYHLLKKWGKNITDHSVTVFHLKFIYVKVLRWKKKRSQQLLPHILI